MPIPHLRTWLLLPALFLGLGLAAADKAPLPRRTILVCASQNADPEVAKLADGLAAEAKTVPTLQALLQSHAATEVLRKSSEEVMANYDLAAYNHLVVVGLAGNDPLMKKVSEFYITLDEKERSAYALGWGHLQGDLGYLEADRNPFLHNRRIREAPFEAELVKVTGNSLAGVQAAAKQFRAGMFNGLVPAGPWKRPKTTILDLAPLVDPPALKLPETLPAAPPFAGATLAGWSQVPANEYRAYLDLGQAEPKRVWRAKYLVAGALDQAAIVGWNRGLHRMAFDNAVTIAEFATGQESLAAAQAIIKADKAWQPVPALAGSPAWEAEMPSDECLKPTMGRLFLLSRGRLLLIASLPKPALAEMLPRCKENL